MNESGKTLMATIPTDQGPLVFVHPCEQALDFPSTAVTPECAAILRSGPNTVLAVWGDQFNSLGCQLLIERITVVGTIPHNSLGSSHRDGFSERRFDKGDFMWRSRSRVHGEWKTRSVCNNHELRTFAPLGLSDFGAPFFATVKVPSMKHSVRSIPPRSSRSRARASSIFLRAPAFTQRLNRLKQVDGDGKRSGRSAHEAPVRKTKSTPSITARSSWTSGRPRPSARTGDGGISGERMAHCSSVSRSYLLMRRKLTFFRHREQRVFMK